MAMKITSENFESVVLNSEEPVLVDFWAEWCVPCQMLAPVLDEISEEDNGVKVGKVNVDEEMQLAMEFKVSSIPMLVLFKDGKAVAKTVGVQPKEEILRMVAENNGSKA